MKCLRGQNSPGCLKVSTLSLAKYATGCHTWSRLPRTLSSALGLEGLGILELEWILVIFESELEPEFENYRPWTNLFCTGFIYFSVLMKLAWMHLGRGCNVSYSVEPYLGPSLIWVTHLVPDGLSTWFLKETDCRAPDLIYRGGDWLPRQLNGLTKGTG